MMTALILPKLGMCRTRHEAVEKLEAMGACRIGSGFYATVYRVEVRDDAANPTAIMPYPFYAAFDPVAYRPAPRLSDIMGKTSVRIIKIADTDPGGLMVAKAAMLTQDYDDLAPHYYGITEFGGGSWMGELEELRPLSTVGECYHGKETSHLIANNGCSREPNPTLRSTSLYVRTLFDMKAAHERTGKSCHWDIHTSNVMMRGNQPVITDPLSAS